MNEEMGTPMGKPVEILLVEDNPGDVRLTREALQESKLYNNLHVVMDGEAAMDFVRQRGEYADMPRPDLVLLELNLPKKDGREVLEDIKADEELQSIPVVILTTSEADEDIVNTYELHANAYITKPVGMEKFIDVVKSVKDFWFTIVKLPDERHKNLP
jgi:CheY-like chemotaxis protein